MMIHRMPGRFLWWQQLGTDHELLLGVEVTSLAVCVLYL